MVLWIRLVLRLVCLSTRAGVALLSHARPGLPALRLLALAIGTGFLAIWWLGLRRTGAETFGRPIWWDALRPLHGALWLLHAASGRWEPLAADAVLGGLAFLSRALR